MTTRGEINSNFYQIVFVDSQGNPTQVKPEYIANVPSANTANYANYAGNAFSVTGSNVVGPVNNANVANTANSVTVANVVGIGNIATSNLDGNSSNVFYGNGVFAPIVAGANANFANYAGNAFSVDIGNVVGIGNIAVVNLDGNVSNVLFGDGTFGPGGGTGANANYANFAGEAFSVSGSNVVGEVANANYANFAGNAFSVDGANVVGDVAGANHANISDVANSVAVANVVGIGNIATVNLDGSTSNVLYGNGVFSAISITEVANANYANYAGNAFSVDGANVVGDVSGANHANIADSANSVAVANVVGIGNIATSNFDGNSSNALLGNGVFGPVTVGSVANANYANFAGQVVDNTQSNITLVGTLANLSVLGNVTANAYQLTTSPGTLTANTGQMVWSTQQQTMNLGMNYGVTQQVGLENYVLVKASASITNGQVVMFTGANGDNVLAAPANAASAGFKADYIIGVATQNIANNDFGYITVFGLVNDLNTLAYNVGDILWYDPTSTTGGMTATQPTDPNFQIQIAAVTKKSGGDGHIQVRVSVVPTLTLLTDVTITSPTTGQTLIYNGSNVWVNGNSAYANTAGTVTANAQPNITSLGILTSLSVTGNIDSAFINANGVGLTNLTGANVVGDVAGANHANIADAANSVAVANVVGIGNIATSNFDGNGSNALLGNGIFGAVTVSSVANANYAAYAGNITIASQPNITSLGTLTSLSVTGNVDASFFVGNGSALTGVVATATPAGLNTYVQFNDAGVTGGNASFTFSKVTGVVTSTVLSATGNVSGNILVSRVTTGTAPLTVTSTTLVPNLFVAKSNVSDYSNIVSSGLSAVMDIPLVASSGNQILRRDTTNDLTYTSASGTVTALEFDGKLVGVAGGTSYVQVVGSTANIVISGTTRLSANSTGIFSNGTVTATRLISNIAVGTAPLTVTSTTQVANLTAEFSNIANISNSVAVANVVGIGNIATSNFDGNSSNALLGNGVFGPITVGTVANANYAAYAGNVTIAAQPNITSLGILTSLSVSGNIDAGYINANGIGLTNITAANVVGEVANANYAGYAGNVTIAAQSNITSVGTLASLSVSGSATVGNVISTGLGNVANVLFTKYNETVVAGGSVSGTLTPDASAGTIYNYTLTGSITINSLANAVAGTGMTIILTQGGSGSYTLTSTMKFLGGTKTLSTSVGAIDIVSVFYDGTNYYATLGKGFA